jgi:hypothetical protein
MSEKNDPVMAAFDRGVAAFLRFTARTGDSLRVASNNAIERLDARHLESRLASAYEVLGRLAYDRIASGDNLDAMCDDVTAIMLVIDEITDEIRSRSGTTPYPEKKGGKKG